MRESAPSTAGPVDVAIVGAGISGLSAAYELHKSGLTIRVLEARERPGGVILTECIDGFVVDAGPDSLLVHKPAAIELCRELGLSERLISTKRPRTAYVYRGGALHPIADGSILGFPTRLWALASSRLFTTRGKIRMAREIFSRPRVGMEDESISSFVRRHFGGEAVEYIAEPLLAGIHAGDVDRLSIRATFPGLVEAETRHGSIIRAFAARVGRDDGEGVFRSLSGGIGELVDAIVARLPAGAVRPGGCVRAIEVASEIQVHQDGHGPVPARAVVLAVPAWAAAPLLQPVDHDLANLCRQIPYWSTATVVLAYPREAVRHPLLGTGFVVPRKEGLAITAGSWVSSKWPRRAPDSHVLLRAFLGGARHPDIVDRCDKDLIAAAEQDLRAILSIQGQHTFARVYRWHRASPQQEVGHLALMAEIDRRLARWPRLYLTGTGFRGVGIPDCIADGRATAKAVAEGLKGVGHR